MSKLTKDECLAAARLATKKINQYFANTDPKWRFEILAKYSHLPMPEYALALEAEGLQTELAWQAEKCPAHFPHALKNRYWYKRIALQRQRVRQRLMTLSTAS